MQTQGDIGGWTRRKKRWRERGREKWRWKEGMAEEGCTRREKGRKKGRGNMEEMGQKKAENESK